MSKETGGPAFPVESTPDFEYIGMTLRDYFAAKAMQSVIASNRLEGWSIGLGGKDNGHIAEISYALADAMLQERAK